MREQRSDILYALGHEAGSQHFRYGVALHRLIQSTGNRRLKGGGWSGGGGFLVHHQTSIVTPAELPSYVYAGMAWGGLTAPASASWSPINVVSPTFKAESDTLSPHGATGYARARPGGAIANFGQYMVEAREAGSLVGPSSIFRGSVKGIPLRAMSALASFKGLGGAYLNYQFGWKPFLSDLRKMFDFTEGVDRTLGELRRNNGRSLHRERVLRDTTDTTVVETTYPRSWVGVSPTPLLLGTSLGTTTRVVTSTVKEKIWFEGRFRYWIPDIGSPQWEKRTRRILFGADVTPSLLWEVMPWSWLIDWFSNVGDVFSNYSRNAADNTVASYAYVMRTSSIKTEESVYTTWAGRTATPVYDPGSAVTSKVDYSETKSRVAANPYGFGLTFSGLSDYQKSILVALGLSGGSVVWRAPK